MVTYWDFAEAFDNLAKTIAKWVEDFGRRKKLDTSKRREIAESVLSGRKSGADMARLCNVSQPTVSRIVASFRHTQAR
jgi:CRP-like cAMP-binding protein